MRFGKPKEKEELEEDIEGGGEGGTAEEPSQMPLMTGGGRPEGIDGDIDYHSMGEGSKLFNKGTLLIVAVLLIAAGGLYAMRLSQGDKGQSEEVKKSEAKIEQMMTQLRSGDSAKAKGVDQLLNDAQFIISQLDVDPSKRQVPVEYTKKNPFFLFLDRPVAAGPDKPSASEEEKRREAELKRLSAELGKFKLQSVIPNGRTPVAIIDGRIIKVGDQLGSFKLKEVNKLGVTLEIEDGSEYTLSIESDPNKIEVKGVKGK